MALAESTQFFQFDSKGNMYVYAPGDGSSGDNKLVAPGDELIFSNSMQWEQREAPLLSQAARPSDIASICPLSETRPFSILLLQEVLKELSLKNFSAEILKKVQWVHKMYHKWRCHRHNLGLEYITYNLEDHATIATTSLGFALCHFIMEVKKVDGSDLSVKTLYDIVVYVQFHLEYLGFAFKLINDTVFHHLKYTLDNTIKQCVQAGIGLSLRQAEVLSVLVKALHYGQARSTKPSMAYHSIPSLSSCMTQTISTFYATLKTLV